MKFAQKIALFRAGKLVPDQDVPEAGLREIGIPKGRFLQHLLFEAGISLDSGSPNQDTRALVGTQSYMNDGGYFRGKIIIGRYVSIGRRVTIGAGHHWSSGLSTSPRLGGIRPERAYSPEEISAIGTIKPSRKDATVCIGHDVWIGDGAIIMPGVTIGTGAVVGANAVLTAHVAPYEVFAGVPARRISTRFPPAIVEALLASDWWELPTADLRTLPLGNILACLPELAARQAQAVALPTYALAP